MPQIPRARPRSPARTHHLPRHLQPPSSLARPQARPPRAGALSDRKRAPPPPPEDKHQSHRTPKGCTWLAPTTRRHNHPAAAPKPQSATAARPTPTPTAPATPRADP
jgi:hypothetical protein